MIEEIKPSIKHFLLQQVKESLSSIMVADAPTTIYKEVQTCINVNLLLGIILEGFINEIGEYKLDNWTWKELEKVTTPLKYRLISGLKRGIEPDKQPMETIIKLNKIRNYIAHPKPIGFESDTIIETKEGHIKINPPHDWKLPGQELTIYIGYLKLYRDNNFKSTLENSKRVAKTILEISELLELESNYSMIKIDLKELNKLKFLERKKLK